MSEQNLIEQMKLVDKIDVKSRAIQKEVSNLRTSIYGVNLDETKQLLDEAMKAMEKPNDNDIRM